MPSYEFTGTQRVYTEGRDASGRHIGLVTPGDRRIFDEPPGDGLWAEIGFSAEGEAGPHEHPGFGDVAMHGTEGVPDGTFTTIGGEVSGSDEGAAAEPEPHDDAPGEPAAPDA